MLALTLHAPSDPVCFMLGSRPIYWYGVLMALAFGAALLHLTWLAKRTGRDSAFASDLVFWCMVGGIVGARLAYVAANWSDFAAAPWRILRIDQGGLVYYGGFLGAGLALALFARRRGEPLASVIDFVIPALPLGHALGRVGCFLNGCCYGRVSTGPLAVILDGVPRLPVQLFEAGANLVLWIVLTVLYLRRPRGGVVLGVYCVLYPLVRFTLEFERGDPRLRWGPLAVAQWLSVAFFLFGLALLAARQGAAHDHPERGP